MAEPRPAVVSFSPYSIAGRQPTPDEVAEMNAAAERRREEIRISSLAMIGLDPAGRPLPSPDAAEEERLATADLRGALRQAQAERREVALRLVDQQKAVERAQQHLDTAKGEVTSLEDRSIAGDRLAAVELADRFRSGTVEMLVIEAPMTSNLDQACRAVEVAQKALDQLTAEAEATRRELQTAQQRIGAAVLDVVRGELLRIAREVAAHDRAADELRANLRQAGFVTANLRQRHSWPARIFTRSTLAVMHYRPPDRPPAATVDWQDFIARLFPDADAELG
jgi:hypothetical protein